MIEYKLTSSGPIALDDTALITDTAKLWRVALDQTTPQGANNRRPDALMQRRTSLRTAGGTLVRSHRFAINVEQLRVQLTNKKPYARIQDQGGTIPALDLSKGNRSRTARFNEKTGKETGRRSAYGTTGGSRVMLAFIGGKWAFFTKRGPIVIQPQHYVDASTELVMRGIGFRWKTGPDVVLTKQGRAA